MTYPEVNSLEESLAILKKYKNEINKDNYDSIVSVISGHAIESIYANERDIVLLVDMAKNNLSTDEAIKRAKARGDF
ncbi:hypothetical protein [Campylobacter ureolyticus]|jgi:hypothetical protein|uniref:Uncharacterized protein n=1 Tax=Campylobacter ureolyticus TaxID=827 RepID=A0A9Q4KQV6_9BACT|nr:hypothetical protein [Campylobacter ureolyticus]MCZ6133814.1 hypothetical protein [Campylobacter ureolyticus]MCZ6162497.1 hypothetical protein [Campylobacter ureolyticus]MCZ6171447.1 hypothetical protein [Campylobacter ureolyticus]MDD7616969.1 hypothetical protein [bacterium]